jgi:hypothetical protein
VDDFIMDDFKKIIFNQLLTSDLSGFISILNNGMGYAYVLINEMWMKGLKWLTNNPIWLIRIPCLSLKQQGMAENLNKIVICLSFPLGRLVLP